jgi:hypothetical protein
MTALGGYWLGINKKKEKTKLSLKHGVKNRTKE